MERWKCANGVGVHLFSKQKLGTLLTNPPLLTREHVGDRGRVSGREVGVKGRAQACNVLRPPRPEKRRLPHPQGRGAAAQEGR